MTLKVLHYVPISLLGAHSYQLLQYVYDSTHQWYRVFHNIKIKKLAEMLLKKNVCKIFLLQKLRMIRNNWLGEDPDPN